jgi:quercetin dioxygenase-like cupin family protein
MNIQDEHSNDAVNVAPYLHTILFEDDKLRVLKVSVRPGDEAKMHWHPRNINYILSAGKLQFTKSDGSSVNIDLSEGQVASSTESSHAVKNIGNAIVEAIQVELKG